MDECTNPEVPQYAPDPPFSNDNCEDCGSGNSSFYTPPPTGNGKKVEMLPGTSIAVEDLSDIDTYRFRHNFVTYTPLSANYTILTPYIAGVDGRQNGLVLFGRTVDRVDSTWSYNKAVTSQALSSAAPGFVAPTLLPADRTKSVTGLAIVNDISFTITGDDGAAQSGSVDADSAFVRYGNLVRWGKGASKVGLATSGLQALFNGLASSINTNVRGRSILMTGGVNEYDFYFLPVRFGTVTFQKGIFVGGFVRLKNVAGVLKDALGIGDVESPISINNGYAAENYYVYMTLYDNQADPTTPVVAS